ncbi:MAG: right-handed parallel beta-helix repeat-containing protein [Microbacterium sp.]|nr:right-handed parallel beta-helix repeat-containing protein [Microbacterium sp.]MBN9185477.1 right-handed parallel beta-helix repeat-containing protein [Microbacterium sp.]
MESMQVSRRGMLGIMGGGAAVAASVVASGGSPAQASTFGGSVLHVAPHGNDSNSGTLIRPFRTIGAAYRRADPGDTVLVEPGVYTEPDELTLDRSGTAAAPIVIRSRVKHRAVIENYTSNNLIAVRGASHNVVQDFEMRGSKLCGIYIVTGDFLQVIGNDIHHTGIAPTTEPYGQEGILSSAGTRGHSYIGNLIHHNGRPWDVEPGWDVDHGMYLQADDELIVNNVIAYNRDNGIQVAGYETVSNMRIYQNVLAENGHGGMVLWMPVDGVKIRNNIFADNGQRDAYAGLWSYDAHGTGVEISHNCFWGNAGGALDTTGGGSDYAVVVEDVFEYDPLFKDPSHMDFRLRLTSPAINAGTTIPGIRTDILGRPRVRGGRPDLGAYEMR